MEYGIPSDVWFPVVTLIIGSILKGLYDLVADQRVERREKAARLETRRDAQMLRKAEFQRKTILELQEEVAKLARATGQMNHADNMEFRKTGVWGKSQLPDEANRNAFEATTRISMLRVRIHDKGVRETAGKFTTACANVALARSQENAEAELMFVIGMSDGLGEQIGEVLRGLDRIEENSLEV